MVEVSLKDISDINAYLDEQENQIPFVKATNICHILLFESNRTTSIPDLYKLATHLVEDNGFDLEDAMH